MKNKLLPKIIISIVTIMLIIITLQIVFEKLVNNKEKNIHFEGEYSNNGFFVDDSLLGYKPKAGFKGKAVKKAGAETVYEVEYIIDGHGRRVTQRESSGGGKALLVFGDSYVFGEGVGSGETLPARLAMVLPGMAVYNYGCPGYGPQQMLAKLEEGAVKQEIPEKEVELLYVFNDDQVNRAIGSLHVYTLWGRDMPYYVLGKNGELERKGSFSTGRKNVSALYGLIGGCQFVRYFLGRLDFPPIGEKHIELTAAIIVESKKAFLRTFKNGDFAVVFFPGARRAQKLAPYLKAHGIKYLDYSSLIDMDLELNRISVHDRHPSPGVYKAVAERIGSDMGALTQIFQ